MSEVSVESARRVTVAVGAAILAAAVVAGVGLRASGDDAAERGGGEQPRGLTITSAEGVVTRPDGSTVDTGAGGDIYDTVVLADGRVVVRVIPADGHHEVRVYDTDGASVLTETVSPEGMRGNRTASAWVALDGHLRVLRTGAADPLTLAAPPRRQELTEEGIHAFSFESVDCAGRAADCAVTVRYEPNEGQLEPGLETEVALRVTGDDWVEVDLPRPERERVSDVSPDGTTRARQLADGCAALEDVDSGETVARTCDVDLGYLTFSPDGRRLVETTAEGVLVFDLDLRRVRTVPFSSGDDFLDWAWADDDTLVYVVMQSEPTVPGAAPGVDRPSGEFEWTLVDVPIDGRESSVRAGPVLGPHHDHHFQWVLRDDLDRL